MQSTPTAAALPWLIGLRWHAVGGQLAALAVLHFRLHASVPVFPLLVCTLLLAASNIALSVCVKRGMDLGGHAIGYALLFDSIQLTVQLALTGGANNPFAVLYLVEILVAVLTLCVRWIIVIAATSVAGFSVLFAFTRPIVGLSDDARMFGTWIAVVLAIAIVGYLGRVLSSTLKEQAVALERSQRLASHAERLASLGTLAAGAAHELGTPLGTIAVASNELDTLIRESPEEAIEEARAMRDQVERCRAIVARMAGRAGTVIGETPEEMSVAAVLAMVRYHLAESDRGRIRILGDMDLTVKCPVESLAMVLAGIVSNGLQATDNGAPIEVSVSASMTTITFAVRDHGSGIPRDLLPRLGEPFVTTKPAGKGMGRGLFLAQSCATLCSGSLSIDSELHHGTTVCLSLPLEAPAT
jgi:two-component system sensor histidine kinase RegB